jgi:hypothetical protein
MYFFSKLSKPSRLFSLTPVPGPGQGSGNGRIQKAIKRAFIANNGQPLTAGTIRHYAYPRLTSHEPWHYCVIRHACESLGCVPVNERRPGVPIRWAQPRGMELA